MIKWSKGSGKMEDIPSLNTNTLTNKYCQKMHNTVDDNIICKSCYSYYMLQTFRKNCADSWQANSELLSKKRTDLELPYVNAATGAARFHSHGEIINKEHVRNFFKIARKQPDYIFTLWTKKHSIVNSVINEQGKPNNLLLVYSNEFINSKVSLPKNFDKVFNVVTDENNKNINCHGKCRDCMLC